VVKHPFLKRKRKGKKGMKKFLTLIIILAAFSLGMAYSTIVTPIGAMGLGSNYPGNVAEMQLGLCDSSVSCSLGVGKPLMFGPYNLSKEAYRPAFKYIRGFYNKNCLAATTDSVYVDYMMTAGLGIADTVSSWTAMDTITGAGKYGIVQDLSGKVGGFLWFRIKNAGAAVTRLGRIAKQAKIRILGITGATESPNTKTGF
jgi:hypothetical protein